MDPTIDRIAQHLRVLVDDIGARPPGSPANRRATDYVRDVLADAGLSVEEQPFHCRWWEPGPAAMRIGDAWLDVPAAPFGRPCEVAGRIARIETAAELETIALAPGRIVVIDGELTVESFFPKAFPFLELRDQRRRIARLEALSPAAVIAISALDGPFAIFEDPDLAFPYLAVPPALGARIADGSEVAIRVGGAIHDGSGVNLSAGRGGPRERTVVCAHIDSKVTTPGAIDNAGGVATLLALAETGPPDAPAVELVFFNGEDHYVAPGEQAWLAATDLDTVRQVVNLDGAGGAGCDTSVAAMACPPEIERRLADAVAERPGWSISPPWYESDHAMFAMRGIPSLAITSAGDREWLGRITHTDRDNLAMVDPSVLVDVAAFILEWVYGRARVAA